MSTEQIGEEAPTTEKSVEEKPSKKSIEEKSPKPKLRKKLNRKEYCFEFAKLIKEVDPYPNRTNVTVINGKYISEILIVSNREQLLYLMMVEF